MSLRLPRPHRYLTPRLSLIAITHFVIDSCSNFVTPLFPLLIQKLDLSLTLVGTLVALSSITSSLAQPVFGLWSDRLRRPWFIAFGPLVAAVFLCSVGRAPSFGVLVALLMLGGLGVAAFHPQAAVAASTLIPRRGLAMSIFVSGGTVGFSIGPLIAVGIVSLFGLENTWVWSISGVLISIPLFAWFARMPPVERPRHERASLRELKPVARHVAVLYFTTVCRYAVGYGFMMFLPILMAQRGHSFEFGGLAVSAYLTAGAIGAFMGGWLSDRTGSKTVLVASLASAIPFFYVFLALTGPAALAAIFVGSFMLQASLPVMVVMGHEIAPRHGSTMAGLLMGAAWGVGLLLMGPVGALADATSIPTALAALAGLLVVGTGLAVTLPDTRFRSDPVAISATGQGGVTT